MWWYEIKHTEHGYILNRNYERYEWDSLPIPLLCVAVKLGKAWIDCFDVIISQDIIDLAQTYNIYIY